MNSLMNLSNDEVIITGLKVLRGMILPKSTDDKIRYASEIRLRLANYYYEDVKKRLSKNKKVTEDELHLRQRDVTEAEKALFK